MAQAYSPGLSVTDSIVLKKERILPLKGKVLVKKGDKVKAEDLVAETLLPGKVVPFNISNKLGVTPPMHMQYVEVIPEEGVIIENKSAYIQGIFGIGGERFGEIKMLVDSPEQSLDAKMIDDSCKDKIIVCGTMVSYAVIKKAQEVGVCGIITGGIDDRDLKQLLGYNIGVAITGHEEVGLTIVVTEGFGEINMAKKTYGLLKQFDGHKASIHGITQIRAGVMRPEIIIPIKFKEEELTEPETRMSTLEIGTTIRVIRQPNFGVIGKVTGLPEQLTKVESETLVRILEAELENGEKVTLPRANVEVIED
jgi:hypothetical protein